MNPKAQGDDMASQLILSISNRRERADRAPHLATGAVVDASGSNEARALYAAFREFNQLFFGGGLAAPLILITQAASARTLGDYIAKDVHGLESRIRIAPSVLRRGMAFARDVLLHEMIHAWQHEIDQHCESGYRGHGPRFAAKCNAIGAHLELPPVGVKGRGGAPDCAHWPLNVRPACYYPTRYAVPTRRKPGKDPQPTRGDRMPRTKVDAFVDEFAEIVRDVGTEVLERLVETLGAELVRRGGVSAAEASSSSKAGA